MTNKLSRADNKLQNNSFYLKEIEKERLIAQWAFEENSDKTRGHDDIISQLWSAWKRLLVVLLSILIWHLIVSNSHPTLDLPVHLA